MHRDQPIGIGGGSRCTEISQSELVEETDAPRSANQNWISGRHPWNDAIQSGVQNHSLVHSDASSSFYEKLKFLVRPPGASYPLSGTSLTLLSSGTPLPSDGSCLHACQVPNPARCCSRP